MWKNVTRKCYIPSFFPFFSWPVRKDSAQTWCKLKTQNDIIISILSWTGDILFLSHFRHNCIDLVLDRKVQLGTHFIAISVMMSDFYNNNCIVFKSSMCQKCESPFMLRRKAHEYVWCCTWLGTHHCHDPLNFFYRKQDDLDTVDHKLRFSELNFDFELNLVEPQSRLDPF